MDRRNHCHDFGEMECHHAPEHNLHSSHWPVGLFRSGARNRLRSYHTTLSQSELHSGVTDSGLLGVYFIKSNSTNISSQNPLVVFWAVWLIVDVGHVIVRRVIGTPQR